MIKNIFLLVSLITLSEEELRFNNIYKQGYDSSCGVAVTASLLNTFWNIPITENELIEKMIIKNIGNEDQTYTISFLTIQNYLRQEGISTRAYKIDWTLLNDSLEKRFSPIIIHYERPRAHFALLFHIEDEYAFVADPAHGFELVNKKEFEKRYSGNAMLTASNTKVKNIEYIEKIKIEHTRKLNILQNLASVRRYR